jgi:putative hydrolase of the HAD superfamily
MCHHCSRSPRILNDLGKSPIVNRQSFRAVIFDIGGVLTESPVTRIRAYAAEFDIPEEARQAIFVPHDGPWSRFERSELTRYQFAREFESAVAAFGARGDGAHFLEWFFQGFPPRKEMIDVVYALREHVSLGVITNNVVRDEEPQRRTSGLDVHSLFPVVIESAVAGIRKPDPRIFHMCCDALGVTPPESIFLDDLGVNLKGARALGMHTIKVDESLGAIAELEEALGIPLPHSPTR